MRLAKELDFALVESPSGGRHCYFYNTGQALPFKDVSRAVGIPIPIGLLEVDFLLGGITAPNLKDRRILHLPT
jgi:hypothetical protein